MYRIWKRLLALSTVGTLALSISACNPLPADTIDVYYEMLVDGPYQEFHVTVQGPNGQEHFVLERATWPWVYVALDMKAQPLRIQIEHAAPRGTVECRIYVDDVVVERQRSQGAGTTVCDYR